MHKGTVKLDSMKKDFKFRGKKCFIFYDIALIVVVTGSKELNF